MASEPKKLSLEQLLRLVVRKAMESAQEQIKLFGKFE